MTKQKESSVKRTAGTAMKQRGKAAQWRVARTGVRFTVRQGRQTARDKDGKVRTFRTRDAAARIARELNAR